MASTGVPKTAKSRGSKSLGEERPCGQATLKIGRVMCFVLGISAVTNQTKVVGTARRSELERTLGSFLFRSFHYINEESESQTEKGRNPARGGISV